MGYPVIRPIIISETEKIEVGDLFYDTISKSIHKVELAIGLFNTKKKILVLSQHFSPEQLQMIVDGKFKDGYKVLVECEKQYHDGDQWHYKIKEDVLSRVILHELPKKTFTTEEVETLLKEFAEKVDDSYRMYTSNNVLAWDLLHGYGESKEKFLDEKLK